MKAAAVVVTGGSELQKSRSAEQLASEEAIKAKCFTCMGGYPEGTGDCLNVECALHPFTPYRDANVEEALIKEAILSGRAKLVTKLEWQE